MKSKSESSLFDESSDYVRRVDFDALNYLGQKRYRPGYDLFKKKGFFNNMYIGLLGGFSGILPKEDPRFNIGYSYGIYLTKFINSYNGLRASFLRSSSHRDIDNELWKSYDLSVDHLFNLTTYLYGFYPFRKFELLTLGGVGYHRSSLAQSYSNSFDAHIGLQFKVHAGGRLDVFLEPRMGIYSDAIDLSHKNWRGYDVGYNVLLGANYRLGTSYSKYKQFSGKSERFLDNTFISFSSGVQNLLSTSMKTMGFGRSMGTAVSVSMGKWLTDITAARLSLFTSYNAWKPNKYVNSNDLLAAYGGGRVEVMINPFGKMKESRIGNKFAIIPMGGLEFGFAAKQDALLHRKGYAGFTAAMQFKYQLDPNLAIFLEPRYSRIPYSSFYKDEPWMKARKHSYADDLLSLSLGVEIQHWKNNAAVASHKPSGLFRPHLTLSTGVGATWAIQQRRHTSRRAGHLANLGVTYLFNPVSGLRAEGGWGTVFTRIPDEHRQYYMSGALDYVLNLNNLLAGYHPERRWNAEFLIGPVFSLTHEKKTGSDFLYGLETGGRLSFRTSPNLDIYVEPKFRGYLNRAFPESSIGTPLIAMLNGGAVYHLSPDVFLKQYHSPKDCNWFFGLSFGGINSLGNISSSKKILRTTGTTVGVHVGKWMLPYWGIRASFQSSSYKSTLNPSINKISYLGGRLESMFNPFRIGQRRYAVELIPMFGVEAGALTRHEAGSPSNTVYSGLTGALQLRFNTKQHFAFYLEPRAVRIPYSLLGKSEVSHINNDNNLSLSLGLEFVRPSFGHLQQIQSKNQKFIPHFTLSTGVGAIWALGQNSNPGHVTSLGVDYLFNPISGLRLSGDLGTVRTGSKVLRQFYGSGSVVYILNFSNLFAGYDSHRHLRGELFAGPSFGIANKSDLKNFLLGIEFGGRLSYSILPNFDLYLEPKFHFYNQRTFPSSAGTESLGQLSGGTVYHFSSDYINKGTKPTMSSNWFLGVSGGLANSYGNLINASSGSFINTLGPVFSGHVGKWLSPFWALRGDVVASYYSYMQNPSSAPKRLVGNVGGRVQALLNPFRFKDRRYVVELIPMAGIEAGMAVRRTSGPTKRSLYTALTGALQLRFNTNQQFAFFIEPRATRAPYAIFTTGSNVQPYNDNNVSLSLGVELVRPSFDLLQKAQIGNKKFIPHFSLSTGVGAVLALGETRQPGHISGLSVDYLFNPVSGLRLSTSLGTVRSTSHVLRQFYGNMSLDYVLNLSNCFSGYDSERSLQGEVFVGPSFGIANKSHLKNIFVGAEVGGRLSYKVLPNFDLYIEPKLNVYNQRTFPSPLGSRILTQFSGGTSYHFSSDYINYHKKPSMDSNWFMGFSVGGVNSISAFSQGNEFWHSMGPSFSGHIGKWLTPFWGVRGDFLASSYSSNRGTENLGTTIGNVSGRFQALLNPFRFKERRFVAELIPMAGIEAGLITNKKTNANRNSLYTALTGALQLRFNTNQQFAIFLEPRVSRPIYALFTKGSSVLPYNDNNFSLSLGFEFVRPSYDILKKYQVNNKKFKPHFSLSTGLGAALAIGQAHRPGHAANISLDYLFNPVSGLRFSGDLGTVRTNSIMLRQLFGNGSLSYVLNLSNLFLGYDSDRNIGGEIFAGPSVGIANKSVGKNIFIGADFGGRLTYRLAQNFALYLEPKLHVYGQRTFPTDAGSRLLGQLSGGTVYHFNSDYINKRYKQSFDRSWFIGASMGAVNSFNNLSNSGSGHFLQTTGPMFSGHIGKWLAPYWGLRGDFVAQYYNYANGNVHDRGQMVCNMGARFEALLNPFRFTDRRFKVELIPMAGIETGFVMRQSSTQVAKRTAYTALTAALQLKAHATKEFAFFVEPRATRLPYSVFTAPKQCLAVNNNNLNLSFGVEITRPTRSMIQKFRSDNATFEPYYFASLGVGLASQLSRSKYATCKLGIIGELNGGYQFNPYSGLRLNLDYTNMSSKNKPTKRQGYTTVAADYLWDVSRSFAGYDSKRKFGVEIFAGPFINFGNSLTTFGAEGGARAYFKLKNNLDLFAQPRGRIYSKDILPESFKQEGRVSFSFTMGVTHKF